MNLTLNLCIDIPKLYLRTKHEVCRPRHSKVRARTGQTEAPTDATETLTLRIRGSMITIGLIASMTGSPKNDQQIWNFLPKSGCLWCGFCIRNNLDCIL